MTIGTILESETDGVFLPEIECSRESFRWFSKYLRLRYLVQISSRIRETCKVEERIAYTNVRKKNNFPMRSKGVALKFIELKKKVSEPVLNNVQALHINTATRKKEFTQKTLWKAEKIFQEKEKKTFRRVWEFQRLTGKDSRAFFASVLTIEEPGTPTKLAPGISDAKDFFKQATGSSST